MTRTNKETRANVLTFISTAFPDVYVYGVSPRSKKNKAVVNCGFNHHRDDGVLFILGVDADLPTAKRSALWLDYGHRMMTALETAGFTLDRARFGSDDDGRSFFVLN